MSAERAGSSTLTDLSVSAVVLAHNRRRAVGVVLDKLVELPVDEIVVVDNGSMDGTGDAVREHGDPRIVLVDAGGNIGLEGRNLGAERARGSLVLFLDDDSYPAPGAIERMVALFDRLPKLAILGGYVQDVDLNGAPVTPLDVNSFDWFLRGGRRGPSPDDGFPAFFFPEGACLVRRDVYLEIGGYPKEFFFAGGEIDVSTRALVARWDVRYLPDAVFHHMRDPTARFAPVHGLRFRIRNHLWYLYLRMPARVAVRQAMGYLAFDLVEVVRVRAVRAWFGGIADAWRLRKQVRGQRSPIPRSMVKRVTLRRARAHVSYLFLKIRGRLRRRR